MILKLPDKLFFVVAFLFLIFHARSQYLSSTPDLFIEGDIANSRYGVCTADAGDVNNDGFNDIIVGAYNYSNGQSNEGAAFLYLGGPLGLSETPVWVYEGNSNSAYLGYSLSTAGDVNNDGFDDVVIGAFNQSNGHSGEGKAYVFLGNISGLESTPVWSDEGNQAIAQFGYCVTGGGDFNNDGYDDIAIGARLKDNGQANEGMVYVYHGNSTGISSTPNWIGEENFTESRYGISIDVAGDVNNDGYDDLIVGAFMLSNGQNEEGGSFLYHGSSSGLNTSYSWFYEMNSADFQLGRHVHGGFDINNDGYSDIAISSYQYDNGQTNEGQVLIFEGSSSGLGSTYDFSFESNQDGSQFGSLGSSDLNNDGYDELLVGAYLFDNEQQNEGRIFIYKGCSTGLELNPLIREVNIENAYFGFSVSGVRDVNGDGSEEVIVGSYYYTNDLNEEGAIWVYYGLDEEQHHKADFTFLGTADSMYFGNSVSTAGDVNGDGISDVIISATHYDNGQKDEGIVYLYLGSLNGLEATPSWQYESNIRMSYFGSSIDYAGDVNGDGFGDVIIGASQYHNAQVDEGAAYVFYGNSSGLSANPDWFVESNQADAFFGVGVAGIGDVNGDGFSDVAVGAYAYDNGQMNEGAVFVYHGSASGLSTAANWQVESNEMHATMGLTVQPAGDVNGDGYSDFITGAHHKDDGGIDRGKAYVYHGSSTGLSSTPNWSYNCGQNSSYSGKSVSSCGDINGDGFSDVVVGSAYYDNGEVDEGKVDVFLGSISGLSSIPDQSIESNQASAYFGDMVSIAGDINIDGYSDVIVGSYSFENGQYNEGAAFLYYGSSNGLDLVNVRQFEGNAKESFYGECLSPAGDVNGDGIGDIIIGASHFTCPLTWQGAAFIYLGQVDLPNTSPDWIFESNQYQARLGISVSNAGDVNGDGFDDVIAGAALYDNPEDGEGVVFGFYGSSSGLNTSYDWLGEIDQDFANYGYSISIAGDVNGDGYDDIIIGAFSYDNSEIDEGGAFVYYGSPSGLSSSASWSTESNQAGARCGISVSNAGDVNGDGFSDVIVGSYWFNNGRYKQGKVDVFYGSKIGLQPTPSWTSYGKLAGDFFGKSVSTAGDVNGDGFSDIIVGAYGCDNSNPDDGSAYVYHGGQSGLSKEPDWEYEYHGNSEDNFGWEVSTAGDVNGDGYDDVVVSAYKYDNGETDEGAAFLFYGSSSGLSNSIGWMAEGNQSVTYGSHFGTDIACVGDLNNDGFSDVAISAYHYDNDISNEGKVFIYFGSENGLLNSEEWSAEGNKQNVYFGRSVSSAGDINGDGFSDIIVGVHGYWNPTYQEGAAFVFYGNNGGNLNQNIKLYDYDQSSVFNFSSLCDDGFAVGQFVKNPSGRAYGALQVEVTTAGQSWGSGTTSINPLTDLGVSGIEIIKSTNFLNELSTQVRARCKYDPTTSIDGRIFGHWNYPQGQILRNRSIGLYGGDMIIWNGTNWCKGSGLLGAPGSDPTKRLLIHGDNAIINANGEVKSMFINWPHDCTIQQGVLLKVN